MTLSCISKWSQPALLALLALALLYACPAYPAQSQADCNRILANVEIKQQISALLEQHKIQEARSVARKRVANIKDACGESNRSYAKALRDLADIELALHNLAEARELTQAALSIREVLPDINPLDLMANRWQLARLEMQLGLYDVAKPLLESALADVALSPMKETTLHADILQDQASLQAWEGRFAEAEASLAEAQRYIGLSGSLESRVVFESRAAKVYRDIGLLDIAERYLRNVDTALSSSVGMNEFGQDRINTLHALTNSALARVLVRKGQHKEAARIATDAVQTLLTLPEAQRWMASGARLPLAEAEAASGRPVAALAQLEAALQHPFPSMQEAEFRHAMALAQGQLGRYPDALQNIARAITIQRASTSSPAPRLIRYLELEAELLWSSGDIRTAQLRYQEIQSLFERLLMQSLAALPEVRQRALLNAYATDMSSIVSFHFAVKNELPASIDLAMDTVLQRKGRQLDSAAGRLSLARLSQSEAALQTVRSLTLLDAQIAAERLDAAVSGSQGSSPREQELVRIKDSLERKLYSQLPPYLERRTQTTARTVAKNLPSNAVLVEYLRYKQVLPGIAQAQGVTRPYRYAAFIITAQGKTASIDLGEAGRIDAIAEAWLRAIVSRDRELTLKLGHQIDAAILEPVLQVAPNHKRIFVAGDGTLAGIPFAALVGPDGEYRVESRFVFSYLTTGSELLRPANPMFSSFPPVVIGATEFDAIPPDLFLQSLILELGEIGMSPKREAQRLPSAPNSAIRTAQEDQAKAEQLLRNAGDAVKRGIGSFPDLPGTVSEVKAVAKRLGVTPIVGKDATKLEFQTRTTESPWILHIGSHGYILKAKAAAPGSAPESELLFRDIELPAETTITLDPMLLSGIVFSGVNKLFDYERAVVTALELSALDLSRTELVVLSACNTASGEVTPGEGVIGLRRALELSGAHASITSLWSISDQRTAVFMDHFYEQFLKPGKDKADAVTEAQLAMLAKPATAAPALWAPFVLSGRTDPSWRIIMQPTIRWP